jgi:hypothetical protein
MRSAMAIAGSCQGASPSSPSPAGANTAPFSVGESGVEPSRPSMPTRNPFSHSRCPSEKGALGGMISSFGGTVIWVML